MSQELTQEQSIEELEVSPSAEGAAPEEQANQPGEAEPGQPAEG